MTTFIPDLYYIHHLAKLHLHISCKCTKSVLVGDHVNADAIQAIVVRTQVPPTATLVQYANILTIQAPMKNVKK